MVGVFEGGILGRSSANELLALRSCYSCGLSHIYEALRGVGLSFAKPILKGVKGKLPFLFFYFDLCFSSTVPTFSA